VILRLITKENRGRQYHLAWNEDSQLICQQRYSGGKQRYQEGKRPHRSGNSRISRRCRCWYLAEQSMHNIDSELELIDIQNNVHVVVNVIGKTSINTNQAVQIDLEKYTAGHEPTRSGPAVLSSGESPLLKPRRVSRWEWRNLQICSHQSYFYLTI